MFGMSDSVDIRVKSIVQSGKIAEKGFFFSSVEDVFKYMSDNDVRELFFYKEAVCGLECITLEVFEELFKIGKGDGKTTDESVFVYQPAFIEVNGRNYRVVSSFSYISQADQHYVVIYLLD